MALSKSQIKGLQTGDHVQILENGESLFTVFVSKGSDELGGYQIELGKRWVINFNQIDDNGCYWASEKRQRSLELT